ncbi:hypothetical protein K504DRAFT_458222 [Pleomassaria siparia CBS 279.74]|uniref:C3H1-type domain-containing protein n=1 Tax=Pleomassaria siparia CBS 279.74 TaxID=1314801 RepID=A0A6G1K551_9PLEO|nr:hypothetical protein K504DRAFT_458222 [Pleomassaria siparia CBS 279.74]
MTGFRFPPPPPPPPRAPASDAPNSHVGQRDGSSNRGGERGRGRGWGGRGRGRGAESRGNAQSNGSSRAAYGDAQSNDGGREGNGNSQLNGNSRGGRGNGQFNGGGRGGHGRGNHGGSGNAGGHQSRGRGRHQQPSFSHGQAQQQQAQPPTSKTLPPYVPPFPVGAYVNPLFANQYGAQPPPQVDHMALAQAMAFMTTPAGMHTMAAFSNMVGGVGVPPYPQSPAPPLQQFQHQTPSQPGHAKQMKNERAVKWNTQNNSSTHNARPSKQKPPRAKAKTAPAIPNFGSVLPTLKRPAPSKSIDGASKKNRRMDLGLTQRKQLAPESSSSDEDEDEDVDEEAMLSEQIINKGAIFEHEGLNISLQTPAEIAAWIKDRKRQYPTTKRIAEKAKEKAEKREGEIAFLRKVNGDTEKRKPRIRTAQPTPAPVAHTPADIRKTEEQKAIMEKRQAELQDLRNRLHESLAINRAKALETNEPVLKTSVDKPQSIDLGLGYSSDEGNVDKADEEDSSELEDSSVVSSSSEESEDSEDESDSDSDAPPEEMSAKKSIPQIAVPPPPPIPAIVAPKLNICTIWKQYGHCKNGNACRWEHPRRDKREKKTEMLEKPKGLFERLVEQEKDKADMLALDAIKFLGQHGFLG